MHKFINLCTVTHKICTRRYLVSSRQVSDENKKNKPSEPPTAKYMECAGKGNTYD